MPVRFYQLKALLDKITQPRMNRGVMDNNPRSSNEIGRFAQTLQEVNMVPFAIAGVQMHVPAMHDNVAAMVHRVDLVKARFPWMQMVVFSELAACGPVPNRPVSLPGDAEEALQKVAAKHGVWLVSGSIFEKADDGRMYNTCSVIDPAGAVIRRYRKMFPFRPYEHDVTGGTEFCVFDVPGVGRFGVSICYDIWFPETTRTLTSMGVEVLLHPVLTGTIDRDVELSMARSAAAQFQCYVFDINGLGAGGVGRSCVVDPAGTVLHQSGEIEEFIPIEIDLQQVRRQRETGIRGLGQVLKSFRDREVDFDVYDRASGTDAYLHTLGPLSMPHQGSRAGLDSGPPNTSSAHLHHGLKSPTSMHASNSAMTLAEVESSSDRSSHAHALVKRPETAMKE